MKTSHINLALFDVSVCEMWTVKRCSEGQLCSMYITVATRFPPLLPSLP